MTALFPVADSSPRAAHPLQTKPPITRKAPVNSGASLLLLRIFETKPQMNAPFSLRYAR